MITGAARVAGVIGHPVAHSRSPAIHGHWLAEHGLDGAYVPLAVRPEALGVAVRGLAAAGFRGFNVTLPHKEAVMAYLDEVTPLAHAVGAVNTVAIDEHGWISGTNTDVFGFAAALERLGFRAGAAPERAAVLGAGGAARAVVVALATLGTTEIRVFNRTAARTRALLDVAATFGPATAATAFVGADWEDRALGLEDVDLLVNTTSLGMTGQPALELDLAALPAHAAVADIVYSPLETELLRAARARGLKGLDGLWMLLHQARPGFAVWFGVEPAVSEALHARIAATL